MIIPIENKCLLCKRIFCCPQCRIKHEQNVHLNSKDNNGLEKNDSSHPACSICTGQPFTLQRKHSHEILKHLVDKHLPLRCNKCSKVFNGVADFLAITACKLEVRGSCDLRSLQSAAKISVFSKSSLPSTEDNKSIASTATYVHDSPTEANANMNQSNISHTTPVAEYNMRWNSKVGQGLLTDSISSIRNASSLLNNTPSTNMQPNQMTQSPNGKSKLVRQTSTPLQRCFSADSGSTNHRISSQTKKLNSFDSINSSEQMSSIYTPNHTCGSESSPSESVGRASPSKPKSSRLRKKLPVAATPLRQVMSRSIQKAMVQHGLPSKYISSRAPYNPSVIWSPASCPLDLRTSPVIRRTISISSDSSQLAITSDRGQQQFSQSTESRSDPIKKASAEISFSPNSKQLQLVDSVYESCKSFDNNEEESLIPMATTTAALLTSCSDQTPKTSGVLIKANSFAERRAALRPNFYSEEDEENELRNTTEAAKCVNEVAVAVPESTTSNEDTLEEWFTPCGKLRQSTSALRGSIRHPVAFKLNDVDEDDSIEAHEETFAEAHSQFTISSTADSSDNENVFYDNENVVAQLERPVGSLWSLVTSVIRMASFGSEPPQAGISLLKRCASYAGRMVIVGGDVGVDGGLESASDVSTIHEIPSNKRRRTKTSGSQADISPTTNIPSKIMGRPPLKRMRRVPN